MRLYVVLGALACALVLPSLAAGAGADGGMWQLPLVGLAAAAIAFVGAIGLVAARRSRRLTPASG